MKKADAVKSAFSLRASKKDIFSPEFSKKAVKHTAFAMKDSNFILYRAVLRISYYQQNPKNKNQKGEKNHD